MEVFLGPVRGAGLDVHREEADEGVFDEVSELDPSIGSSMCSNRGHVVSRMTFIWTVETFQQRDFLLHLEKRWLFERDSSNRSCNEQLLSFSGFSSSGKGEEIYQNLCDERC